VTLRVSIEWPDGDTEAVEIGLDQLTIPADVPAAEVAEMLVSAAAGNLDPLIVGLLRPHLPADVADDDILAAIHHLREVDDG
jgi:hypothetical protein